MKSLLIFTFLLPLFLGSLTFAQNFQEVCQLIKDRSLVMSLHHNSTSNILFDSSFWIREISTKKEYSINLQATTYADFRMSCGEDKLFFSELARQGLIFQFMTLPN